MLGELVRFPFHGRYIEHAPHDTGVLVLWEGTEITRIGLAASPEGIKGELHALFIGQQRCACTPTHYSWFISKDPLASAGELMKEHSRYFDATPRCNRS